MPPPENGTCPDRDALAALSLGTLPADAWEALAAHVEGCARCAAALRSFADAPDGLVASLRRLKGSDVLPADALPEPARSLFVDHPSSEPLPLAEAETATWNVPRPLSELPAALPFPVHILPPPLARLVEGGATMLGCPSDYLGLPLLVLAGGAVGASRALQVHPGCCEWPCLHAAVIGPDGSPVGRALHFMAEPLYAEQRWREGEFEDELLRYEDEWDAYRLARKGGHPAARPEKPQHVCIYVAQASADELGIRLRDNRRGLTLIQEDLADWLGGRGPSRGKAVPDTHFWSAAWAGQPLQLARNGPAAASIALVRPFLAVVGGLSPASLRRERTGRTGGREHLARLLFAFPSEGAAPTASHGDVAPEDLDYWGNTLTNLRSLVFDQLSVEPSLVALTAAARQEWRQFAAGHAAELQKAAFPPHLCGPWDRLQTYWARLALILQLLYGSVFKARPDAVEEIAAQGASQLVAYFKSQARRVYAALEADPNVSDAGRVLRWLAARPDVTTVRRRDLYQCLRCHFRHPDALDEPLALLASHGYVRRREAERAGPGRKADAYDVNPRWDRRHHAQNSQNTHNSMLQAPDA